MEISLKVLAIHIKKITSFFDKSTLNELHKQLSHTFDILFGFSLACPCFFDGLCQQYCSSRFDNVVKLGRTGDTHHQPHPHVGQDFFQVEWRFCFLGQCRDQ